MSRKSMFIVFGLLIIGFVFIATLYMNNSNPTNTPPSSNPNDLHTQTNELENQEQVKHIFMQVSLDDEEFMELESLSKAYEDSHPGVKIQLENIPKQEAYEKFKKASQLGEAADVMLFDNVWVNEFAALAYLSEVDDTLVSDIQTLQIAPMVSQMKWNGFLWGVPKDIDPYILVWNRDRLSEERLEPPSTTDEFISMNHLLYNEETENYGVYFDFQDPYALISLIWTLVGSIDHPEITSYLTQFFNLDEMDQTDEPTPLLNYPVPSEEWHPWELLNEGKIAMMISRESAFRKYASEQIQMMALPPYLFGSESDEPIGGGWLKGQSYVVSAKSTVKEEAFEWIQSLISMESQLKLMKAGGALPTTISTYEAETLRSHPFFAEITKSIEEGGVFPAEPELSEKIEILQQQMNEFWLGQQSIHQFVMNVQKAWFSEPSTDILDK